MSTIRERVKGLLGLQGDRNASRVRRRIAFGNKVWKSMGTITFALLAGGYAWMLAIPSPSLGQQTYIDENALQPGQVSTYWSWDDVHRADQYLAQLEQLRDRNASSQETAQFVYNEFLKLGIPAATQEYSFKTSTQVQNGTNAYAIFSSPRASGAEAMLVTASRISRTGEGDGSPNLRGMATVLSLAAFLKGYSLWAKDLIFVISDGYLDGMHAWISTYHGAEQDNLRAQPLELSSGVIWTALNIDYPGHSFSDLGVFFEGVNGRLPNQDLINSFQVISRHTGGVPVLVYDHQDPRDFPGREDELFGFPAWVPEVFGKDKSVKEYAYRARNILRHIGYQTKGKASGPHGLLHRFRIDAVTLFAVPAAGPHGFHAIGRIVESTLRTTNNLLERLHASFFFYLLVGPATFLKIGMYLPSAVLISTAMLFAGLHRWVNAYWYRSIESEMVFEETEEKTESKAEHKEARVQRQITIESWSPRERPVLEALGIMIVTHLIGAVLFFLRTRTWLVKLHYVIFMVAFSGTIQLPVVFFWTPSSASPSPDKTAPLWMILQSLNLCLASTVISITSVLNFSLAASLAILVAIPLIYSAPPPPNNPIRQVVKYLLLVFLAGGWLIIGEHQVAGWFLDWELVRGWFAPFVCMVYYPLVLQASIVSLLPS